jgi:hypothetical protein
MQQLKLHTPELKIHTPELKLHTLELKLHMPASLYQNPKINLRPVRLI